MVRPILYRILRPLITLFFKLFFHPNVIGTENIPNDSKIILAGNHTNFFDIPLLISCTNRTIHFLAKYELTKGPLGILFRNMGIIPVNRQARCNSVAFDSAVEYLKDGHMIGIFPEGTINREMKDLTLPFKKGAVRMAYEADCNIIPFSIVGKYNIFGKGVTIVFGEPYMIKSNCFDYENECFREKINTMIMERR